MALSYIDVLRNTRLQDIIDEIDAGAGAGTLRFYDGTPPADADTALSGNTLLAQLTFSDPCGTKTGGVLTFSAITADSSADATGTGSFWRALDSDANVCVQGTLGTSGADINLNSLSISTGQNVEVTSFTITEGNA